MDVNQLIARLNVRQILAVALQRCSVSRSLYVTSTLSRVQTLYFAPEDYHKIPINSG